MSDLPQRMNKTPTCSVCLRSRRRIDPTTKLIVCLECDIPILDDRNVMLPVIDRLQAIEALK